MTTRQAGRIVNTGTPAPHQCSTIHAPGRPWRDLNNGTVWECSCGTYYKMKVTRVVDMEGDDAGTEERWYKVKNAAGDEWERVEVNPREYLTTKTIGAVCVLHGRVTKSHRHHQWA